MLSRIGVAVLVLGGPLVVACTVGVTANTGAPPEPPINVPDGGTADGVAPLQLVDGGAAADAPPAPALHGSPLCNASDIASCFPDYGWACNPAGDAAGAPAADGGGMQACRVGMNSTPTCAPAGSGGDGAPCAKSSDCSPGFECVGAGQCRHYCCDEKSCAGQTPDQLFCDIQPTAGVSAISVPVCMPVAQCTLIVGNQCPNGGTCNNNCAAGQQCSIVTMDGTTSCVAIGNAGLGDSCDSDHCGAGLVCLGMVGSRVCWQLCSSYEPTCPGTLKCHLGGPIVPDPNIGICDK